MDGGYGAGQEVTLGEGPAMGKAAQTLSWALYEKPATSSRPLSATSAYPWRKKLVTMNMEVFRRLRNTMRQMTLRSRTNILREIHPKTEMFWIPTDHSRGNLEVRHHLLL